MSRLEDNSLLLGMDFSGVEARIMAHTLSRSQPKPTVTAVVPKPAQITPTKISELMRDYQRDALAAMLNGRRDRFFADEYAYHYSQGPALAGEQAEALQKLARRKLRADFIDGRTADQHGPAALDALIWGPEGEFTGCAKLRAFYSPKLRQRPEFEVGGVRFEALPLARYSSSRTPWALPPYETQPSLVRFQSYRDWAQWLKLVSGVGISAEVVQASALFFVMQPQKHLVEAWIAALRSGDFAFGFGLLRDAEDTYDALGVLAEISAAEWSYDQREDAYAVGGQASVLAAADLAGFLGVPTDSRIVNRCVCELRDLLLDIGLAVTGFEPVARLLVAALAGAESLRNNAAQLSRPASEDHGTPYRWEEK